MNKKGIIIAGIAIVLLGSVTAHKAEAISFSAFIDLLIEKGLIAEDKIVGVREVADILDRDAGNNEDKENNDRGVNAEHVAISVSQFVQFGTRTYTEGEGFEGLLMQILNVSDNTIALEGRRQCLVSYRIVNDDAEVVFDSALHNDMCSSGETITYALEAKKTRLVEVNHSNEDFALEPGEYTIELVYPGYATGEREITIVSEE